MPRYEVTTKVFVRLEAASEAAAMERAKALLGNLHEIVAMEDGGDWPEFVCSDEGVNAREMVTYFVEGEAQHF